MQIIHSVLLLLFTIGLTAQQSADNQWIMQFDNSTAFQKVKRQLEPYSTKCLSESLHIYLFEFDPLEEISKGSLEQHVLINSAGPNLPVNTRVDPNDPVYPDQWNLTRIEVDKVWDTGTGGTTANGTEIVIAIIDEGFDFDHAEMTNNLWLNQDEIPGNNIDDDANGYPDDIVGIDLTTDDGDINIASHGTGVAGIIGAEGDNELAMTGINWNTRMMLVSGADSIDKIIAGYDYVLEQRKRFNESNGAEGAYVVATNLSLGVGNQFGSDWPIWCNMYDALGEQGVLNVGATTNGGLDVSISGDLPSTCPNEHLIVATTSDEMDGFNQTSGFSEEFVDLGAPGFVTSLGVGGGLQEFQGTSASSPHVAGLIALLYSIDCEELYTQSLTNPAATALFVKRAILDGTDKFPAFQGVTSTGGRLNAFNALLNMSDICGENQLGDLDITVYKNPTSLDFIELDYITNSFGTHDLSLYDTAGRLIDRWTFNPELFGSRRIKLNTSGLYSTTLHPGLYILTIENENDHASTKLMIAN